VSGGIVDETGEAGPRRSPTCRSRSHGNIQLSGSGALGDYLSDLIKTELGAKQDKKLRMRAIRSGTCSEASRAS